MNFEFDAAKSAANRKKHGIDFVAAQELWQDIDRIDFPVDCTVESRSMMLAMLNGKLWAAVYTMRGASIRLISVRRARDNEKELYEQEENNSEEI
ncbi:MAG: BrnT family toxin [Limisphaerales bacterium]